MNSDRNEVSRVINKKMVRNSLALKLNINLSPTRKWVIKKADSDNRKEEVDYMKDDPVINVNRKENPDNKKVDYDINKENARVDRNTNTESANYRFTLPL